MRDKPSAILFDLDGTLVDTAPDLVAALSAMRTHFNLSPLADRDWSAQVAQGGRALVAGALGDAPTIDQDRALAYFLSHYEAHLFEHSTLYPGMVSLLDELVDHGYRLGVVTNKRHALAVPLLAQAKLATHFDVVVGGDSTPHPKPRPEPVMAACDQLGVEPGLTVMIGDDRRDIEAATRAGAGALIAGWGYGAPLIDEAMRATTAWVDRPDQVGPALQRLGA